MTKPIIGITLDWQKDGSFSPYAHNALRVHYFDAIEAAGGIPIGIPANESLTSEYLKMIDGLLLPGGDFALAHEWYEEGSKSPYPPSDRLNFERQILRKAVAMDMPILGICAGMQILACEFGAKMKMMQTSTLHRGTSKEQEAHKVNIQNGTLLHSITGTNQIGVNSAHLETIVNIPDTFHSSGIAPDGIIEAIEMKDQKFVLGLEWHPEHWFEHDEISLNIFKAFTKASSA